MSVISAWKTNEIKKKTHNRIFIFCLPRRRRPQHNAQSLNKVKQDFLLGRSLWNATQNDKEPNPAATHEEKEHPEARGCAPLAVFAAGAHTCVANVTLATKHVVVWGGEKEEKGKEKKCVYTCVSVFKTFVFRTQKLFQKKKKNSFFLPSPHHSERVQIHTDCSPRRTPGDIRTLRRDKWMEICTSRTFCFFFFGKRKREEEKVRSSFQIISTTQNRKQSQTKIKTK